MKLKFSSAVALIMLLVVSLGFAAVPTTKNYFAAPAGGSKDNKFYVGGNMYVTSGGALTVQSGGTFTISAGATVVSTAAAFMNITGAAGLTVTNNVAATGFYATGGSTSTSISCSGDAAVGTLTSAGAASCTTLNTGQGAYELYAMNQNVQSSNAVSFAGITNTAALKRSYVIDTDSVTLTATSVEVHISSKVASPQMSYTLPTAVGNGGLTFTFRKGSLAAGIVTIIPAGSELINGVAGNDVAIDAVNDFKTIMSDNANWVIINRYIQ